MHLRTTSGKYSEPFGIIFCISREYSGNPPHVKPPPSANYVYIYIYITHIIAINNGIALSTEAGTDLFLQEGLLPKLSL